MARLLLLTWHSSHCVRIPQGPARTDAWEPHSKCHPEWDPGELVVTSKGCSKPARVTSFPGAIAAPSNAHHEPDKRLSRRRRRVNRGDLESRAARAEALVQVAGLSTIGQQ